MSNAAPENFHDRIVPPSGAPAWLTTFTAGAMTFLAVFALALSLASDRLATRWAEALNRTATIRISAPDDQMALQTKAVLSLLAETPGIAAARALTGEETRALLEPWFGPDLPLTDLPLPQLVELTEAPEGYDGEGLRQRLAAEAPGAVLDDHLRWRRPLAQAASTLRLLGLGAIGLIGLAMAAMITLAASAALAANAQVIKVLRLVGATDSYIARAFTRRFTMRAATGAAVGALVGAAGVFALPAQDAAGGFLTGLGFTGWGWLLPLAFIPLAALVAFVATQLAALRTLRGLT
ncbi:cell division protein FtsX [Stagnihabitans tardus]|uniref:Cell division protein FtsX n=1 Tax=Stagnihabitans tardus TaxID=2699202 RepID=A0AAE4YAQ0_9RHOB|nr:cell division protein FtsX [Stagnihabitans tardus]